MRSVNSTKSPSFRFNLPGLMDFFWRYSLQTNLSDFLKIAGQAKSLRVALTTSLLRAALIPTLPSPAQVLVKREGYKARADLSVISPWLFEFLLKQQTPDQWFSTAFNEAREDNYAVIGKAGDRHHDEYSGCVFRDLGVAFFDLRRPKNRTITVFAKEGSAINNYLDKHFWANSVWRLVYDETFYLEPVSLAPITVLGDIDPALYARRVQNKAGIIYGPSGSGKTELAVATLRQATAPRILLLSLKNGLRMTQKTLRPLLSALDALKPTGIVIDDCPLTDVDQTLELLDRLRPYGITTLLTYMHNEAAPFGFAGMRPGRLDAPLEIQAPTPEYRRRLLFAYGIPEDRLAEAVGTTEGLFPAYLVAVGQMYGEGVSLAEAVTAALSHARIATASRQPPFAKFAMDASEREPLEEEWETP